ncbi:hypothetical protein BT69DRAFT_950787 [Atractiella rhizophila]|nr:hypothetical protein BT69DRAFT_950787 [Atractiella rhizophila]
MSLTNFKRLFKSSKRSRDQYYDSDPYSHGNQQQGNQSPYANGSTFGNGMSSGSTFGNGGGGQAFMSNNNYPTEFGSNLNSYNNPLPPLPPQSPPIQQHQQQQFSQQQLHAQHPQQSYTPQPSPNNLIRPQPIHPPPLPNPFNHHIRNHTAQPLASLLPLPLQATMALILTALEAPPCLPCQHRCLLDPCNSNKMDTNNPNRRIGSERIRVEEEGA